MELKKVTEKPREGSTGDRHHQLKVFCLSQRLGRGANHDLNNFHTVLLLLIGFPSVLLVFPKFSWFSDGVSKFSWIFQCFRAVFQSFHGFPPVFIVFHQFSWFSGENKEEIEKKLKRTLRKMKDEALRSLEETGDCRRN